MATEPSNETSAITTQPISRKVSIQSDPATESRLGYDNLGYELNPKMRKISQSSMKTSNDHIEVGPVRKKSILVNNVNSTNNINNIDRGDTESEFSHHSYDTKQNGDARSRKLSHNLPFQNGGIGPQLEQSWVYALCMRCRVEYNTPSWEPPYWQKVCPYPLCPSFRQFANILSIVLIGILGWLVVYTVLGHTAAPGGQLFGLVVLTVAANFGGWLISLTRLPGLIGMLIVGLIFQNVGWVDLDGDFSHLTAYLRKIALTIILIRAGLEMDPHAFKKVYKTILKLGLVPWAFECCIVAILTHFFLGLPWIYAFALGSILSAVAPAVVVPCLFRFRVKGYGVAKGIPTLIIAVAGIDDAASVALMGIITSIIFNSDNTGYQIAQAPVCIIGGLAFAIIWGVLLKYIPEKGDSYVVPIRTLLLLGGGLVAIFGSEHLGFEGAGPLGVVFAAFISNYFWCQQGWEIEDSPVSTAFEIFWMIFEPILFGITGATIKIWELDPNIISIGVGCILAGVILRICVTVGIAFGDKLNLKEKIFVALSWMAKATVQAALGPVILKKLGENPNATEEEKKYGQIILTIAILSIILTAPIGALLISVTGTKLLTKTKQIHKVEGWRRSHRPSLYDISIIDEEEEREDPEKLNDDAIDDNKSIASKKHSTSSKPAPSFYITKF